MTIQKPLSVTYGDSSPKGRAEKYPLRSADAKLCFRDKNWPVHHLRYGSFYDI